MNCHRCATPLPDDSHFCLSCGADVSGETAERTLPIERDPELQGRLQEELGSDFILERELGRGGMAVVFLGRDAHLGRRVAVKVLPPELTFGGGGLIERFKREARMAATLDHPNIIPVHRVSTGGKLFWYVMKYVEGESLDRVLARDGQIPLDRAVEILRQVADALHHAHRRGIIHRDVKPANVLLDADGRVTVTDFGIAKALDTSSLTGSGAMIGTPYYMAPEQCSGSRRVSGASDQYSLGVMAYQMLAGHVPFTGESVVEIIKKHCMDPPPPVRVLRPAIPPRVVAALERALAKDPDDRFPTVFEFATAFAAGARDQRPAPEAGGKPLVAQRASETLVLRSKRGAPRISGANRRTRPLILVGAVAIVAAGVALVILQQGRRGVPHEEADGARPAPIATGAPPMPPPQPSAPESVQRADSTAPAQSSPVGPPGLVLRGVPSGAAVTRDGRRIRGSVVQLEAGRRSIVRVSMAGFEPWADTITPGPGQQLVRTVSMQALRQASSSGRGGAAPAGRAAPEQQPVPEAVPKPQEAAGVGYITVGSRPLAPMTIEDRSTVNPVSRHEVQAGAVRLRFLVTDSIGSWTFDTTVTVAPGEHKIVGRIPLLRRP